MKLIAEYILKIYQDGSIELVPLGDIEDNIEDDDALPDFSKCSSRIAQVLNVVLEIALDNQNTFFEDKVTEALNKTVKKFGLHPSTIVDKCTRQLSLVMDEFKRLVYSSIEEGDDTLEKLLLSKVGAHTRKADEQAIKRVFKYIKNIKGGIYSEK